MADIGLKNESDSSPYTSGAMTELAALVDGNKAISASGAWGGEYSYGVDMGSVKTLDGVRCWTGVSGDLESDLLWYDANFKVLTSDDNSTWVLVDTYAAPALSNDGNMFFTIIFVTPQSCRYVKVVNDQGITVTFGSEDDFYISEIEALIGISKTGIKLEPDTSPYTGTTLELFDPVCDDVKDFRFASTWGSYRSYGIDFRTATEISVIKCYSTGRTETSWRGSGYDSVSVYESDDNATWTLVETFNAPDITYDGEWYFTLELSSPATARFFKVVNIESSALQVDIGYNIYPSEIEFTMPIEPGSIEVLRIGIPKIAFNPFPILGGV